MQRESGNLAHWEVHRLGVIPGHELVDALESCALKRQEVNRQISLGLPHLIWWIESPFHLLVTVAVLP
jgi:hypothetical protein